MPGVFPQVALSFEQWLDTTALVPGCMPGPFYRGPVLRFSGQRPDPQMDAENGAMNPTRKGKGWFKKQRPELELLTARV